MGKTLSRRKKKTPIQKLKLGARKKAHAAREKKARSNGSSRKRGAAAIETIEEVASESNPVLDQVAADVSKLVDKVINPAPVAVPHSPETVLHKIEEIGEQVSLSRSRYLSLKEDAAAAKKDYEAAQERLLREVRASKNDAERPLFNQANPAPVTTATPDSSDAWREVLVSEWFSGAVFNGLVEKKIGTMGEYADWLTAGNATVDLPGVGPGYADQALDTWAEFWKAYPQDTPAPEAVADTGSLDAAPADQASEAADNLVDAEFEKVPDDEGSEDDE